MQRPHAETDIDAWFRASFDADSIRARTRPDDRIVVLTAGGYSYLTSRRDAGIPYMMLWDDRYCEEQWPRAARRLLQQPPRILLIQAQDMTILARHEPSLRELYFGYSGNFMLAERRPGPPLCLDGTWSYRVANSPDALPLKLRENGAPANFIADLNGNALQAHVDEHRVAWFDGKESYVAELARDGRRMQGRRYRHGRPQESFAAELVSCDLGAQASAAPVHRP
jgi:hypothetical protein